MRLLVATALTLASTTVFADEGMWTFHDFPSAKVKAKYGFAPDQAWLDKARLASARIAGTCSAGFVSADGLVDDEPPLCARLHRRPVDEGQGLRQGRLLGAEARG